MINRSAVVECTMKNAVAGNVAEGISGNEAVHLSRHVLALEELLTKFIMGTNMYLDNDGGEGSDCFHMFRKYDGRLMLKEALKTAEAMGIKPASGLWAEFGGQQMGVGTIIEFIPNTAMPEGWIKLDKTHYSPHEYPTLFGVVGYAYGKTELGHFMLPRPAKEKNWGIKFK